MSPYRFKRLRSFLHRTVVIQAMLTLAWSVAAFAAVFGAALVSAPGAVEGVASFTHTFQFAPPHVWGIGFVLLSALTVASLAGPRRDLASFPIWGLAFLTCVWGLFAAPAVATSGGSITAVIIYPFAGFVMLIVGAALDQQGASDAS